MLPAAPIITGNATAAATKCSICSPGRALFTTVGAAGTDEVLVEAGDLLVLEREEVHRGRALEDVTVLFLTPRHGNVAWSDEEAVPPLHG